MTLSELSAEALLRLQRKAAKTYHRAVDDIDKSYITDQQLARAIKGLPITQIALHIRKGTSPHLTKGLEDVENTAAIIKQSFPESVTKTLLEAESILNHQIIIFNRALNFGQQIDWHSDIETGVRWPMLHHTTMPIARGKSSDVRAVWELNRLHHFVTLGRAYALTKDERYAAEFIHQLTSWCESNPPRFGINWTVAMEAGIRAINIIAALDLFHASPMLTTVVIELALKILLAHGRFIRANLEFSHRVSSNHYLSNLIGLFVIGATMPYFKESDGWLKFATAELLKELDHQILADGADFEASISYHRLVLEIFLMFFTLSRSSDVELPVRLWQRLEAMFDFVRAYSKPDQEAPLVGDSDDGRLLKFKERPSAEHSYLLSIAAVLFDKDKFRQTNQLDEEAVWWFGEEGLKKFERFPWNQQTPISQAFNVSQIFIQRKDSLYAIIDCGDHGAKGRGSHAHSDALSFELYAFGQTFLRDPGTFVYTASKPWRHLFRSTAYHNTVRIDRKEISEINQDQPFALGTNVLPKVNSWQSDKERDVLDAEHYGYKRLAKPVTLRRIMTFDKHDEYWLIEDIFTGKGHHLFEFFFNFDAGLKVSIEENHRVIVKGKISALAIVPIANLQVEKDSASTLSNIKFETDKFTANANLKFEIKKTCHWVSPSYRTRLPSSGIMYRLRTDVPFKNEMLFIPFRFGDERRVLELSSRFAVGKE